MIKSWLRMDKSMRTLHSALCWLHPKKKSMEPRMRRVSLGKMVYLIWEERNRRVFEGKTRGVNIAFRRFQLLFYIIFHFHRRITHFCKLADGSCNGLVRVFQSFYSAW
ncbi:hypothetical protein NC653_031932 [Populus alba x Populus x berolinensis]|nr:hypothetical protein NC653_031932 [Populus alba x Populus x berolinensis]